MSIDTLDKRKSAISQALFMVPPATSSITTDDKQHVTGIYRGVAVRSESKVDRLAIVGYIRQAVTVASAYVRQSVSWTSTG